MSKINNFNSLDLYRELKRFRRANIAVAKNFPEQVAQIDVLLNNDNTGLVSTIVDFMIHSSTVSMKIETANDPLNKLLQTWQKNILNANVNIDIPTGLRALSTENFRERWRSSQLALKVIWGKVKFENQGTFIVPKKMWFLDGASVFTESAGALNTRKYFININKKKTRLKNSDMESIFIRKPYTSWHEKKVTPYLVKRGTVFNSLVKNAIVQKQSDVIESIIPLILQMKAGSDELSLQGLGVSKEAFKKLKDSLVDAKHRFDETHDFGDLIASLRHDVNLEYLIPDISKIFDDKIVRSTDRNLLSSLGMIELQGFSSDRQEAILNPKVLVEEVSDAVMDWADLLEDVMLEMMQKNRAKHPNLANNEIQVIPGIVKAFITDDMRSMLRSMYDRGVISKQDAVEDIAGLNFEVQVNRRTKEDERDLQTIMMPPIIQNLEQHVEPDDTNLEDQDKLPNTPESDNFNNAILREYFSREHIKRRKKKKCVPTKDKKCPPKSRPSPKYSEYIIQTPDDLPEEIKKLSFPAQLTYFITYNNAIDLEGRTPDEAKQLAEISIKMFLASGKEKLISVTANAEKITCESCNAEFDYNSVPEISMGAIECPSCSEVIDQTGKKHPKKKKKDTVYAPFENIDELPDNVRNVLPIPAQMIWMKVFNSVLEETGDEERAIRSAWSQVSKTYEKVPDKKKWVKKAQLEDYKSEMSGYAYKLFQEMYDVSFQHCSSNDNSIKTALAIIERVCTKNKDGIWVKDKTLSKAEIEKLDKPDFISRILDLEIKEKKSKLLDKLLEEDK